MAFSHENNGYPFSPQQAIEDALVTFYGLKQYDALIEFVQSAKPRILESVEFRRTFNSLYKVRRSKTWQDEFYAVFQDAVDNGEREFSALLKQIYDATGRVETSFASKMLATLDTKQPIWDSHVVRLLNLLKWAKIANPSNYSDNKKRPAQAMRSYKAFQSFYEEFSCSDRGRCCVAFFDEMLPGFTHISNAKKIDCILWGANPSQTAENDYASALLGKTLDKQHNRVGEIVKHYTNRE